MSITSMTLNIWCYYDWEHRAANVVSLIKRLNPDFLTLQEVQVDPLLSVFPQSKNIAELCGYKYHVFIPACLKQSSLDYSKKSYSQSVPHGLSIISKYPIRDVESHMLKTHPGHKEPHIVLFASLDIKRKRVDICNVHFGNSDLFADLHLNELMEICRKRKTKPIIQGDFNIFNLGFYKSNILDGYLLSSDHLAYKSMPKDNGTLDYIIAPSSDYRIEEVICPDDYISDHKPVFARLSISRSKLTTRT